MTSPVDTSVKHFSSAMVNAPVVNGVVGAGIAWLDALLLTGFDTKTLTSLVVAGGVATATFTGSHSAITDSVILVAGVTGGPTGFANLNGEQKVTGRPLTTTLTFATAVPDGTYTGTITIKMAPAGWTKVFTGTNKAVYKSSDPAGSGMLLRVDDTNAQVMRITGYEAMTDVDTGTGAFPLAGQISGGGYWPKSNVASSAPVAWAFAADSRLFYHSIQTGYSQTVAQQISSIRGFGDPIALRPSGDVYSCILTVSNSVTVSSVVGCLGNNLDAVTYSPRAYSGLGSAVAHSAYNWGFGNGAGAYVSGVTATIHGAFPNPVDGALYLAKKITAQSGTVNPRAELPGLYVGLQSGLWDFFKLGDRTPGTGALVGRNLMAWTCASSSATTASSTSANTGIAFIDVTGPWR